MHDAVPVLQDFLIHSFRVRPDKTALVRGKNRATFAELAGSANRLAGALRNAGVQRGDRVLTFLENGNEAVVSFWGTLLADAVAVPINPLTTNEKLSWLLEDCGAVALIADRPITKDFAHVVRSASALKIVLVTIDAQDLDELPLVVNFKTALDAETGEAPKNRNLDVDLAAIIYTSGSLGEQKGVMLSHRNMLTAAASICQYLEIKDDDVILSLMPLAFDYGLYQMIMSIRQGSCLVLEKSFTLPAETMKLIAAERVTILPGLPTLFAMLAQLNNPSLWDLSSVRTITSSGAPLPLKHIEMLRRLFPNARLFSMFGLTECKRCTYLPPADLDSKPESVGIAIPNTELWLVDEVGNRVGPNQVGQLVIRGATVMQGYWRKPEETARMLRPGSLPGERVLYTGDLCRLDEEGYLYFVGRVDEIIKSRGKKVAPAVVEAVLTAIPGVKEAAVIGVPDAIMGTAVKAFVVPDVGRNLDEAALLRECRRRLDDFMVPRQILLTASLPRTSSGKIRKTALS
jgi:amino acid adenylation domain-containing protein